MAPLVDIVGVGAFEPSSARWVEKGARIDVDAATAARWAEDGVAAPVEEVVAAEQAVTTDPAGTATAAPATPGQPAGPLPEDVESWSVAALKKLVKERGLTVGQARTRPALLELLRASAPEAASTSTSTDPAGDVPDPGAPLGDDELELPEDDLPDDLSGLSDGQLRKLAAELDVELPDGVTRGQAVELIEAAETANDDDTVEGDHGDA